MKKLKYIAICTPTLGDVSIFWASALRDLLFPMNFAYMPVFCIDDQGGEIAEARNRCVKQALSYENDHRQVDALFWIDDDVLFPRTTLLQLHSHFHSNNADISSGVYFTKSEVSEPLIFPGKGQGTLPFIPDKIYKDVWGWSHGISLIKTEVYKQLADDLDLTQDKYGSTQFYKTETVNDATIENETLFTGGTEDMYFFSLVEKINRKIIVDCSRTCFGFHWDNKTRKGYPLKQWEQKYKHQEIIWQTDGTEFIWK